MLIKSFDFRRSRQKDGTEKSPDGKPVRSDQTVDDSNIFVEPVPTKPIEKATSNNLIKQDSEKSDLQVNFDSKDHHQIKYCYETTTK